MAVPGLSKVMLPNWPIDSSVGTGAAVPSANRSFKVALGSEELLLAGTACQMKASFTAELVLLLKDDATRLRGCELLPALAVALPAAGSLNGPRTTTPPLTSSFAAGLVLPIPI